MKTLYCLILTLILTSASLFAEVAIGDKAPDFTLLSSSGERVALSDFAGKFVVLEWTSPSCPFVKKFYDSNEMQRLQREFADKDVVWLSIDSSRAGHRAYMTADEVETYRQEKQVASMHTLLDPAGEAGRTYSAATTPHMFVINPEGVLIYQGAIDSITSVKPEDIALATNYVVVALEEAMSGMPVSKAQTPPYGCSVKY